MAYTTNTIITFIIFIILICLVVALIILNSMNCYNKNVDGGMTYTEMAANMAAKAYTYGKQGAKSAYDYGKKGAEVAGAVVNAAYIAGKEAGVQKIDEIANREQVETQPE
jgi:uncharacterized protein YxeA